MCGSTWHAHLPLFVLLLDCCLPFSLYHFSNSAGRYAQPNADVTSPAPTAALPRPATSVQIASRPPISAYRSRVGEQLGSVAEQRRASAHRNLPQHASAQQGHSRSQPSRAPRSNPFGNPPSGTTSFVVHFIPFTVRQKLHYSLPVTH